KASMPHWAVRVKLNFVKNYMKIDKILQRCVYALCLVVLTTAGCAQAPEPDSVESRAPSAALEQLSFDERMAIRARLTRIKAEAQRKANELYDPFKSRDAAINNETYATRLRMEGENELKDEFNLTDADLE